MIEIQQPRELGPSSLELLKAPYLVLDQFAERSAVSIDTGPIEIPQGATGGTLVLAVGSMSSVSIEGTSDGGQTWQKLQGFPCGLGFAVVKYEQEPATPMSHLRVKACTGHKGAKKVGFKALD